uniref:putative speedy protein E9 n=1 Tax=Myodes glareolus TaxID=447135 RepID=UPI0020202D36|nr:putative speedy protein E9 [Myodes glareolus]
MSCLGKQRRQDSFISTTAASDTTRKLHNTMKGQKKKGHGKAKTAMSDRRSEMSTLATKESCKQNDTGKEVHDDSICLAKKALQASSIRTAVDGSAGDAPDHNSKKNKGQRERKLENVMINPEDIILISSVDSPGGGPEQRPINNSGPRKRKLENVLTDPEDNIILISSDDAPGDGPEQQAKSKKVQKTKSQADVKADTQESRLQASGTFTSEATLGVASELKFPRRKKRNIWTVDHIEGTKLTVKKRRLSYRPEDLEAFYQILEDPVVQNFLAADIFFRVTDKYLLSMVVEYFGRLGLPGHLYNRIHFFLALYIACDMEEDDPISKRSIFQFLLGTDTWQDLYKDFQRLQGEFLQVIDYRAWLTRQECEEIQNQNPHHWVWSRVRQSAP